MEKAIEIKRRAQRCIQNGDLDGALVEYEKLVGAPDSDPYNFVLLADLLFKKGDPRAAAERYLAAASAYNAAGLYKNGIAVCKKMMRLSLAPLEVFERLAELHALDGLATEASLYYMQHAELLVRENKTAEAARSLRLAFESSGENVKAIERLGEVHVLSGDGVGAAQTLLEAAGHYDRLGQMADAERCRRRSRQMDATLGVEVAPPTEAATEHDRPRVFRVPDPSERTLNDADSPSANGVGVEEEAAIEPHIEGGWLLEPEPASSEREADPMDVRFERLDLGGPDESAPASELEPLSLVEDAYRVHTSDGNRGIPPLELDTRSPSPAPTQSDLALANSVDVDAVDLLHQSPASPGLQFAAQPSEEPPAAVSGLPAVERLLARAQQCFRTGDREAAGAALADAARAYEDLGRADNAASIYRSLGKSAHASGEILTLWLRNCELREDGVEGAQVACELGDRALNAGDIEAARGWFERALELDASNDLSSRRLQRLAPAPGNPSGSTLTVAPPAISTEAGASQFSQAVSAGPERVEAPVAGRAAEPPPLSAPGLPEPGRVEVAVGRGEAVTFDLGSLISEFQRGVEAQLSGDAQSHYDLAMAYREMGLLEQAVESFRVSAGSPLFVARATEMIGRCLLDQGRFEDAAQEFSIALERLDLDPATVAGLSFQLGLAYEAAGMSEEALVQFERVYSVQPNFPDAALKIRVLRKSLGNI